MFGLIASDSRSYTLKQAASNLHLLRNPPQSCATDVSSVDSAECAIMPITSTGPPVKTSSKYNITTEKMPHESLSFSLCFRKLNEFIWAWLKPDRFQQIKLSFIHYFSLLLYVVFYILPFQSSASLICLSFSSTTKTHNDFWRYMKCALNGLYMLCQLSVFINWLALVMIEPWNGRSLDRFCSPGCHEPSVRLRRPFSLRLLRCN